MAETAPKILIADDQATVREAFAQALRYEGYQVGEAADGFQALEAVQREKIAAVLLDIKMPRMDGMEVLIKLREGWPDLPVVMVSGHGDIETAVVAVRRGAYDFLPKPCDADRVLVSVKNALRAAALARENQRLRTALVRDSQLIGRSQALAQVRAVIAKAAPTDVNVLVTGDHGTGKELVAQQIHAQSARVEGPFVAVNCAAIAPDLVESELFGHEKGAFTGAHGSRAGHFEQADGGTIFLDEVGDMPLPIQAKLLRALQERLIQRVGSSKEIEIDVRVVAATNQDLQALVEQKLFREDLFYRLLGLRIHLPPLRDRPDDIDDLAPHFLQQICARNRLPKRRLAAAATGWLRAQSWPGNVRQLKSTIEMAAVLAEGDEITEADLRSSDAPQPARSPGGGHDWFDYRTLDEFRAATEKEFIRRKLLENHGNIKRTAERIELQRSNLYKKLERYDLK